jgi:hypothetical protein
LGGTLVSDDHVTDVATGARVDGLQDASLQIFSGPVALRSADGNLIVYNSFALASGVDRSSLVPGKTVGTPSIRVHDVSAGTDRVLASGAGSVAWAGGGRLAYVQGDRASWDGTAYRGRVMVRPDLRGAAVAWTPTSDRYTVLAWAGGRLLVERTPAEQEAGGELLVFDGPGKSRVLGGNDTELVGVDPTGTIALVTTGDPTAAAVTYRLLDLATGAEAGKVDLGSTAGTGLPSPSSVGAWSGDAVVVGYSSKFAVFHYTSGPSPSMTLQKLVAIPTSVAPFIRDPYFGKDHTHVFGVSVDHLPTAQGPHQEPKFDSNYVLLDCTLATGTCVARPQHQSADGHVLAPIRNPSRPITAASVQEES